MPIALRYALAVIAGAVVAFAVITAVEAVSHLLFPPPAGLDFGDPEQVHAYMQTVPSAALLLVLAAWLLATFAGGWVACKIAGRHPRVFAGIIGGLILAGTLMNLVMIPHPVWFAVLGIVAIVLVTFVTGQFCAARMR